MARLPSLPLTLARAHLTRRRAQNLITMLGIAVGMMVLITALSLTNGFTRALVDATLRATPHLSLQRYVPGGRDPNLERTLRADPRVEAIAPFLADKGLLTRPASRNRNAGVDFATLFGVTPDAAGVLQFPGPTTQALRTLKDGEVILGSALAQSIGAFSGDELRLLNSMQRRAALKVRTLFSTGNYQIDSAYAFVTLRTLQDLQGTTNITGYQVRLHDPEQTRAVASSVVAGGTFSPIAWQDLYRTLLDQLALQKRVIGFVVFLIVIVAAFGIASVLTLTVFEKTQEIAILRAIGATRGVITRTFLIEGVILGVSGLILGDLLGLAVCAYFTAYPFRLPGDLYFITALPVEVRATDVLWVNAVGLATTLLAAYLPARRAAGVEPAQIIR
ncbi:ABC transporter permease [Deinococcus maricopensis]|uniref:ABC3 transporter permease protein domain-containing protein n=1 Tax=Deinococcus maricopensis (strain DSM 21211 / LMG 22137 / NRRL B-23946 / LB-34) TaxID=709986 RepID=E8U9H9_DEIML|nr:ABC transporter permease [Deinococcus maricopensis]ADV67718.1 protein of unknown function DUF214 [Deinococcus maricopensis DSM 21211]